MRPSPGSLHQVQSLVCASPALASSYSVLLCSPPSLPNSPFIPLQFNLKLCLLPLARWSLSLLDVLIPLFWPIYSLLLHLFSLP